MLIHWCGRFDASLCQESKLQIYFVLCLRLRLSVVETFLWFFVHIFQQKRSKQQQQEKFRTYCANVTHSLQIIDSLWIIISSKRSKSYFTGSTNCLDTISLESLCTTLICNEIESYNFVMKNVSVLNTQVLIYFCKQPTYGTNGYPGVSLTLLAD